MPIYPEPTKILMKRFRDEILKPGQSFHPQAAIEWFAEHFPKIKKATVRMHVEGMSVNSTLREHHPSVKAGSGHDLFFKVGPSEYRIWEPEKDPKPVYRADLLQAKSGEGGPAASVISAKVDDEEEDRGGTSRMFAYEEDLKNYLAKNIGALEKGLRVYQDEDLSGIEFVVGGRRIDILATGADDAFVVVELKVDRGYDRVLGQIARYMGYVKKNLADGKPVRGIIVAAGINEDLKLAASMIPDVRLVEYEISFSLKQVSI